jgi:hypothetical protein
MRTHLQSSTLVNITITKRIKATVETAEPLTSASGWKLQFASPDHVQCRCEFSYGYFPSLFSYGA